MNIRHISVQYNPIGQEIERLELEGEARTLEQLMDSFKQLPQTPLVKSWSAAVLSAVTPPLQKSPQTPAPESAPHSSQSSESDKSDVPTEPARAIEQPSQTSSGQFLLSHSLSRALLHEIVPFLITSSGPESNGEGA